MSCAAWQRLRPILLALVVLVTSGAAVVVGSATPAHADPVCQDGGYYVLWARGSGEPFHGERANAFRSAFVDGGEFGDKPIEWAELGNLLPDNDSGLGWTGVDWPEYPAVPAPWTIATGEYYLSVRLGVEELVKHLNDRYAGDGPRNAGACHRETLILGGYSQGADVVGSALRRHDLSQAAKEHLGYAALYGDPKFNPGLISDRVGRVNFHSSWWWVRGDGPGYRFINNWPYQDFKVPNSGILDARDPYVSDEFKGRFGSWCADKDVICAGNGNDVVHSTAYSHWITESVDEVVHGASKKHNQLNPNSTVPVPSFTISMPNSLPATYGAPPPATIHTVKRTKDPSGTNQVYAATRSAVTEAWWQPGGDGVHVKEMIHISQNNIVGFDKVNEPDGATQSLYTAVPDGVWETWWRPNEGIHSQKIVTGLSGVRQVIADPRWENGQYVHRLYLLAQDGPYEVWWRDGDPSGIHVNRLTQINDPVTMTASTGPSGEYQLYVATPTWVYELWWYPGQGLHYGPVINITQADIDSLSKITFSAGQQRLYTGTSTGVWQSIWHNSAPAHNHEVSGKTGVVHSEAMKPGSAFQIYLATGTSVQEYWWTTTNAGNSTLVSRSQGDITVFDKYNDSSYQQVYTATLYGQVYETYWGGGTGPTTKLLFTVGR